MSCVWKESYVQVCDSTGTQKRPKNKLKNTKKEKKDVKVQTHFVYREKIECHEGLQEVKQQGKREKEEQ